MIFGLHFELNFPNQLKEIVYPISDGGWHFLQLHKIIKWNNVFLVKNSSLLESRHYLNEHFSYVRGKNHKKNACNYRVYLKLRECYCFNWIFSEWSWGQSGECTCRKLLCINVLIIPRTSNNTDRVACIVSHPVIGSIGAIVLCVVKEQVNSNKDACSIIAHHQDVAK